MEKENEGLPRGVRFPVDFMCRMLGVSRAGYYAWGNRGPSAHAVRDAELTEKIREVDEEHKHRCGIERILWELQEDGLMTSQRRVRRLARAAGVECVHPRPYVRTTLPDAQARDGLADLVDRDFRPAAPDQLWVGDITYIHTFSGFAYLATVIDLFSNKGLFEVNRDGVLVRLPGVFSCWLRCVICVGGRGCRRCGRACAGWPGYGTRMPGGPRAWRAGSGSRRRRS